MQTRWQSVPLAPPDFDPRGQAYFRSNVSTSKILRDQIRRELRRGPDKTWNRRSLMKAKDAMRRAIVRGSVKRNIANG